MKCDAAQRAISTAMDERATLPSDVEEHRRTCPICAAFDAGAWRIRELARFEVAPPVPDMVPSVMARVRDEEADRLLGWGPPPNRARAWVDWVVQRRAAVLAAATGIILGLVLTTGGLVPIRAKLNTAALASEIPHQLVRAAKSLDAYRATFDITESNWTKAVRHRTFVADLEFRAPESFRVRVRDTTRYPNSDWPRNDLSLVTDGRTWSASGPDPCPSASLPACPTGGAVQRSVVDRPPFDARAALPSDVIVPMTVLAASDKVLVTGPDTVAGRGAVAVELAYEDATPLFQYLAFLGSWRPFFAQDRVVVWLDRRTWFPLQYKVFPAPGRERALWATQVGLPSESSDQPVFEASIRSLSTSPPPQRAFMVRPGPDVLDEGFLDDPLPARRGGCAGRSGPVQPCDTGGLRLYRFGRFPRSQLRPYTQTVLAYASGLAWLTVTRVEGWDQPALFGIGPFPETVKIPGRKGTGYYLPATSSDPRRIALHTARGEFLVATNLPRTQLFQMVRSMPVKGLPQPAEWRVRRWSGGVVQQGVADARFALQRPSFLPRGYRQVAVQTATARKSTGVTIVYRRPGAELDGVGLVLYQASGQELAPPHTPDEQSVMVGGNTGRWSPDDHLLEWMDGRVYRSLTGPGFDLGTLLRVALSLQEGSP